MEEKGWVVDKWSNNIDLEKEILIPAKRKFNPFSKVMAIGTGFPDFIAFQLLEDSRYKIIGVEVKMNGTLSLEEKRYNRALSSQRILVENVIGVLKVFKIIGSKPKQWSSRIAGGCCVANRETV